MSSNPRPRRRRALAALRRPDRRGRPRTPSTPCASASARATSGSTPGATCAAARCSGSRGVRSSCFIVFVALFPDLVHLGLADGVRPRVLERPAHRGSPARIHPPGLRCLLADRLRHEHLALGRTARDAHRRDSRHRRRRLRRVLRRLARLAAHARRRHLLRDPLHPRGRGHHVGVPRRTGTSS